MLQKRTVPPAKYHYTLLVGWLPLPVIIHYVHCIIMMSLSNLTIWNSIHGHEAWDKLIWYSPGHEIGWYKSLVYFPAYSHHTLITCQYLPPNGKWWFEPPIIVDLSHDVIPYYPTLYILHCPISSHVVPKKIPTGLRKNSKIWGFPES